MNRYEKATAQAAAVVRSGSVGSVEDLRERLKQQEGERTRLRDELSQSERECSRLVDVRHSQESLLSEHDEEIAELSTSMHSGLTDGEGSDMQKRADDVRSAREVVERQVHRATALH